MVTGADATVMELAMTPEARQAAEEEAAFMHDVCSGVLYFPMYAETPGLPEGVKVIREKAAEIVKAEGRITVKTEAGEYPAEGVFVLREAVSPGQLVLSKRHFYVGM